MVIRNNILEKGMCKSLLVSHCKKLSLSSSVSDIFYT